MRLVACTCTNSIQGAFVAAPIGGLLWGFGACALRIGTLYILSRVRGHRFTALDRPVPRAHVPSTYEENEHERVIQQSNVVGKSGKFF